jgi:hypothetical protein
MFIIKLFVALSIATLSLARVLPIVKRGAPSDWWSGLEPYSTYHTRYLDLDCENKHNTSFFTQCCHPRLKDADPSSFPAECNGASASSIAPVNAAPNPTPTPKPTPTPTPKPKSSSSGNSNDNNVIKGSGDGTFFYQNGVAGACGKVHSDSDKVVALDTLLYGNGQYCGKTIEITNTANGKSVQAVVADECPTCASKDSVDMSVGAFTELATEATGEINISWVLYL